MSIIGVIARNSRGVVVGGLNLQLRVTDPKVVKAKSILFLKGVCLAIKKCWTNIIFVSYLANVIHHIQGWNNYWRNSTTISGIQSLYNLGIQIMWKSIPRSTNESTNWISKQARLRLRLHDSRTPTPTYFHYFWGL